MDSFKKLFLGAITATERDYFTDNLRIQSGYVCYNLTSMRLERWDGTSWVALPIGSLVSFPVQVRNLIDDTDQGGAPPAAPYLGASYIVNNWGGGAYALPAATTMENGDLASWTTAGWVRVMQNDGSGGPPSGYRCIVGTTGLAGSFVGHGDDIGYYTGGAWVFETPSDGWEASVIGEYTYHENSKWIYDAIAGLWVAQSVPEGDHRIVVVKDVNLNAGAASNIFVHPTADAVLIRAHLVNWDVASGNALVYQIDTLGGLVLVGPVGPAALNTGVSLEVLVPGIIIPAGDPVRLNVTTPSGVAGDLADVELELVINS